jgi:serine/threonine protein kinase
MINQILKDRYQIKSLLGKKTGRRTFLCEDLENHALVVIKLLLFNPDFIWDDLKLFDREVAVLKSLNHSAIPNYLDSFEVDTELGKGFALVQTYIEARSLQDWVESGRTFSEPEIKEIATELLHILDYLHHRQPAVIHRDLKPSNILLADRSGNSPGHIYLVDFGSVQTVKSSGTMTIVGTYGYMPPEQFGGETQPGSDLYALGATLIYLATGSHPSELPHQQMRLLFAERVNLDRDFIDWLQQMTEPSLDLRPTSASAALAALEHPTLQHSSPSALTELAQPYGSKVRLTKTRDRLEIVIPPAGFQLELLFLIPFAIVWNSFVFSFFMQTMTPFLIFHAFAGLFIIWQIVFILFGQIEIEVDRHRIVSNQKILGLKIGVDRTALKSHISNIEIVPINNDKKTRFTYDFNTSDNFQLNVWNGVRKLEIGQNGRLSYPELDWLAQEIVTQLDLPLVLPASSRIRQATR